MNNINMITLAEKNRLRTTEKVIDAIKKLKKDKGNITISSVCQKANISRKTIYNRPDLKAMVMEASSLKSDMEDLKNQKVTDKGYTQAERLKHLREKNKKLIEDKKEILEQNLILTKKVTELQNRLSDLEEKLYSRDNLKVVDFKKE
jgi:predicted transcriptional regulator